MTIRKPLTFASSSKINYMTNKVRYNYQSHHQQWLSNYQFWVFLLCLFVFLFHFPSFCLCFVWAFFFLFLHYFFFPSLLLVQLWESLEGIDENNSSISGRNVSNKSKRKVYFSLIRRKINGNDEFCTFPFFLTDLFTSWDRTAKWLVMYTGRQRKKGNSLGLNFSSFSIYFFTLTPFFYAFYFALYCRHGNLWRGKQKVFFLAVSIPPSIFLAGTAARSGKDIIYEHQNHLSEKFMYEIELCWELHHIKWKLWCLLFHNFHFLIAL